MKIDPVVSTHLDFGENPDHSSREQGQGLKTTGEHCQPMVPHHGKDINSRRLSARKTRKKRKRLPRRKIAERRARQQELDEE